MNSVKPMIGRGLLVAALLTSAGSALGSDDGFAAFWKQFTAALAKHDQKAVSQMVKYPIDFDGRRQEADFPVIWNGSFKPAQRTCLAKQKPVVDTARTGKATYFAFCGPLIYTFAKDLTGWRLTEFGAND